MPFQEGLTAVYEHGIKPLVESMGMQCKRADEIYSSQGILGDIWDSMQSAEIVIADLTGKNPNVMYELGLCHALWKRVILLSQNRDDVPFDLRAWRVLWYDFTFAGAARLKEELHRAIEALRLDKGPESTLVPLSASTGVTHPPPPAAAAWVQGFIQTWKPAEKFGFVRVGTEDFYFNAAYLFAATMEPTEGKKVVFVPAEALPDAKNRRASKVFVHGSRLSGRVNRVVSGKNYGFADVVGQHGGTHNLLFVFKDPAVVEGCEIECTVSDNGHGPTGTDVKILSTAVPGANP